MDITISTVLGIFFFGLIIGSFLNVVIYRHNTGRGLGGHSHCTSCGVQLSAFELVPLLSYVLQRGSCWHCGARISPQYFVVELITGVLFVLSLFTAGDLFSLALTLSLSAVLVVVVVYDLRHLIIPDVFVVVLVLVSALLVSWEGATHSLRLPPLTALLGGLGAALFFASFWFFSRGKWMGLGDAKLALPLGVVVGFPGVVSMVITSFWIGALLMLALLGIRALLRGGQTRLRFLHAPLTMKSEVPFAPFLVAAFFLVFFFEFSAFAFIDSVMTSLLVL